MTDAHPSPIDWWKHRRRIAYLCLVGLFALIGATHLLPPDQMIGAAGLLIAIAWMFGGIVFSYVAAATAEDIAKMRTLK